MGIVDDDICCGYGVGAGDIRGYDCLVVPQASSTAKARVAANRICGADRGLASLGTQTAMMTKNFPVGMSAAKTICCELID